MNGSDDISVFRKCAEDVGEHHEVLVIAIQVILLASGVDPLDFQLFASPFVMP